MTEKPDRVQLFHTCLVNEFRPGAGRAVVRVLEHAGVRVEVPAGQTCCGQPAYNAGFHREARRVALHTLEILEKTEGPVVIPSGSCAHMIVDGYRELFRDDLALLARAERLAGRCHELTAFLVDVLDWRPVGASASGAVFYHPSCHLRRGLGVDRQPRALLAAIAGLELVPIEDEEECCGFGGLFAVKQPEISGAMLDRKLDCIAASGAAEVVGCDLGCLMHLEGGLRRRGCAVRTAHLAELIERSLAP